MKKGATLITGASSGFGREFAYLAAHQGHDVVLVARKQAELEELATNIRQKYHVAVQVVPADLSVATTPAEIFQKTKAAGIHVDTLINNAGFATAGRFAELELKTELEELALNVSAVMQLTHLFLPDMLKHKRGKILNIASTAAFFPGPYMATYYATKAFILSFSQALCGELEQTGITVTTLCPGPSDTGFAARARIEKTASFKNPKALTAREVAILGYRGMERGQAIVIAGLQNQLQSFGSRFIPRGLAVKIIAQMQHPTA